ncbi:orotidine 5'-phosphate decarboxylase [Thalassorhabdomicrobium marinisediminis]|uniref:Orotidine 5'-phosphate decarboxylase n=1 Tax=Thalassorhabdomicrobium marinisediminis TaxID=2170577 RepID=A0A2T7G0C5_9RHOB|nr:orotidine 5'-phosphate decarboxylase [Thalassorhabdomicrobium marinisediminis]PVA07882.1 orotidine 5'-phosphate decarboxylase [Thalassorhabdomicrobium marinisediminis]
MPDISLGNIRYNLAAGTYEARVDIAKQGRTFRYPCAVPGPLDMVDADVRRGLTQQALTMAGREGGLFAIR